MIKGAQGPTQKRLETAERVRLLRADGWTFPAIAEELGLSRSYVNALATDPEGIKDRARKEGYSQPCPSCGRPMSGSNGVTGAPLLCADCAPATAKEWTREKIIEVFRDFAREFGRSPTASDIMGKSPSQRVRLSDERLAQIDETAAFRLPLPLTVYREFGTWPAAVRAAGLEPSGTGGAVHRESHLGSRQTAILNALAGGPMTAAALQAACGGRQLSTALTSLTRHGLIERPSRGVYRRCASPPTKGRVTMAREFVVLSRNGTGWLPGATVEAPSAAMAVERVAKDEGVYVAVPANYWNELRVGTVTKLAVIQEPTPS